MQHNKPLDRDQFYIKRCLDLAKKGHGYTYPNPMVGAVVVYENTIIGEGWHRAAGKPHAEINAFQEVKDKTLLKKSTLYVSLEPCCHHGKTPPCVDAILTYKIPKIVIAMTDPHKKVAGKGIKRLREAGCEVVVDVLKDQAIELNKRFITFHQKNRPYIILKWAESQDGFIAPDKHKKGSVHWISGTLSRQLVHQWRGQEVAIMVGAQTVIDDDPALTTRNWEGKNPKRFVIDPNSRIPNTATLLNDSYPTTILSHKKRSFDQPNKNSIVCEGVNAKTILEKLVQEEVQSVIIEGGQKTLQSFIDENLWDEARIFKGTSLLKTGIKAPNIKGFPGGMIQVCKDQLSFIFPNSQKQ